MVARALLLLSAVVAAGPPSPAAATRAFGRWLEHRYTRPAGYWTCPRAQRVGNRADCLAEFRSWQKWHLVGASARLSGGRIVISHVHDEAWVRRWSRYVHRSLPGADSPGRSSVNGPAFDWPWLVGGVYDGWRHGRKSFAVNAYDGYSTGLGRFFVFRCVVRGDLVTCRNAFGDAMRY